MSAFNQYYQFLDQGQFVAAPDGLTYGQAESRGSKSPMSTINNPRYSAGPLSTPPRSRNPSQPPEQPPDHLLYYAASSSHSDSPVTIATPDSETLDGELLAEPWNFDHQNGTLAPPQMQQDLMAGTAPMFFETGFPEQDVPFHVPSLPTQNYTFQTQGNFQNSSFANSTSQPYDQFPFPGYTTQPPHIEPWNSQTPQQGAQIPQSGDVIWDPATDSAFSAYINPSVGNWINNTDSANLISPSVPQPPPQDGLYNFQQHTQPIQHTQRRTIPTLVVPSAPAANRSPLMMNHISFHGTVIEGGLETQILTPSPHSATEWSILTQPPLSPHQSPLSPQVSAPSPGGSAGLFPSYPHSDAGMKSDVSGSSETIEAIEGRSVVKLSRVKVKRTTNKKGGELSFNVSPEPEGKSRRTKGGRALGTHLDARVAKHAHDMRRIVACWHCVLQRDKCGPGDKCERCRKRSERPNADCGLGCSRIKLIDLSPQFLPEIVTDMHENQYLTGFVSKHIRQWRNVELTILMTCGQKHMPRIPVKVYEFIPSDTSNLVTSRQYITDPETHKRRVVEKKSPALGMVHINTGEDKKYENYIKDIVENHIDAFGRLAWMEDDNDFQEKLFRLMTKVKCKSKDERDLLTEVLRLIVVSFIMSHTLTIADENMHILSRMHSYQGTHQKFTSPRMTNRQLKFFFSRIQKASVAAVLNKMQQIFKSSKGCDKWLAAFITVLGLCMAHEDMQQRVHTTMSTRAAEEGRDPRDMQARAENACREIDERMDFIFGLFRWKYNRKYNPLRDAKHEWDREVGFGDEDSLTFVRRVATLVGENNDFLQQRAHVSISYENQTKYTSRLIGRFLLSFWSPQI